MTPPRLTNARWHRFKHKGTKETKVFVESTRLCFLCSFVFKNQTACRLRFVHNIVYKIKKSCFQNAHVPKTRLFYFIKLKTIFCKRASLPTAYQKTAH